MEVLGLLIVTLGAAIIAYFTVASESRARGWSGGLATGIYLAVFGATAMGLNWLWSLLRAKLVDDFAGENARLLIGLLGIAVVVVLILDLVGKIQLMGAIQNAATQGQQRASGSTLPAPGQQPPQQNPPQQQGPPQQQPPQSSQRPPEQRRE